jgi:hypothetical protein
MYNLATHFKLYLNMTETWHMCLVEYQLNDMALAWWQSHFELEASHSTNPLLSALTLGMHFPQQFEGVFTL